MPSLSSDDLQRGNLCRPSRTGYTTTSGAATTSALETLALLEQHLSPNTCAIPDVAAGAHPRRSRTRALRALGFAGYLALLSGFESSDNGHCFSTQRS